MKKMSCEVRLQLDKLSPQTNKIKKPDLARNHDKYLHLD
jgi:hypothetical protein